jgi:hypothetical protein
MTIMLPLTTLTPPLWRILQADTWNSTWNVLVATKLVGNNWTQGFFVEEFWRSCIPEPGQATIRYDMGLIDGQVYGVDNNGVEQDNINLIGNCIRIQCAPDPGDNSTPAWRTVWVGVVELHEDTIAPGGDTLIGSRKYHCLDLLTSFTKKQPLNRHGMYINGTFFVNAYGHPGYNSANWDGRILGNRESTGVTWYQSGFPLPWDTDNLLTTPVDVKTVFRSKLLCHSNFGGGTTWTDLQAIENALASSRVPNTPFFYITGQTTLINGANSNNAWPIEDGMNAWDFLSDMFKRQRGRGVAFLDWDDDSANPTGPLTVYIRLNPQTKDDITYTPIVGSADSIPGATTASTTVAVDLMGDHRNVSATFALGHRNQHAYDYVESLGEKIQVLATLDYASGPTDGSRTLDRRWSDQDATDFANAKAADINRVKQTSRWDAVYQLHGLRKDWLGTGSSGSGSTGRCDYRCDDSGALLIPGGTSQPDTAPDVVTVLQDLPLYVGYNYAASTPVRYDGAAETEAPSRRRPLLMVRDPTDNTKFIRCDDDFYSCSVRVTQYGIEIVHSGDQSAGLRFFDGTAHNINQLVVTVGLEMPYRVRMANGDINGARKKQLFHRGLHFWVAHELAIWDLSDVTVTAIGAIAKRGASFLRDDRAKLAREHAMACSWYLNQRRTATWQLKACGFLPGFYQDDGNGNSAATITAYPTIGQVVTTLKAAGHGANSSDPYTINTPITKVHFTNRSNGVTTWITDWSDLDLR